MRVPFTKMEGAGNDYVFVDLEQVFAAGHMARGAEEL